MHPAYQRFLFLFLVIAFVYLLVIRIPNDEGDLYMEAEEFDVAPDGVHGVDRHTVDWVTSREPYYRRRIVGIGDLHGDLPNALKVLKMTDVLDEDNNWSGNIDILVQTGDIIDRGDDTIQLFELMERIREEAKEQGGLLLSNMGNHEWMNAIGDWRYVYPSEIKTFGGVAARQEALASTGWLGKAWAQNYSVTTRLPLHPSLGPPNTDYDPHSAKFQNSSISHSALSFVHGGLAPDFPYLTPYPSSINSLGRTLLKKLQTRTQPPPHPPNPYPGLPQSATVAEKYLYSGDGPLWYRGWALEDEKEACAKVDEVLDRTGTKRLIMGHTPTFTNIVSRCDGKVIIIDTGISHAYGGVLSGLSITYSLYALDGKPTAKGQAQWLEQEKVTAVYEDASRVLVEESRYLVGDYGVEME